MGQKQKNSNKKSTNRKIQKKTHNSVGTIAQLGMFIAVAMVFSYIESFIRIDIAVPGIKLGLADAVLVSVLRIFLSSLLFGNFTVMIYSLAGAAVSMLFMWISVKIGFFSTTGTSILGGVGHNVGQLIVAYLVIKNQNILIYAPVLLISGTITGVLIGLAAVFVMRAVGGQIGKF